MRNIPNVPVPLRHVPCSFIICCTNTYYQRKLEGFPNHPLTYLQHEFSLSLCLRNARWKGPWLTQKLAMWLSCLESRHRLAAWRSNSARSGARHSARVLSTNACWTSRPAWSRRLRPTAACLTEMGGEQKPLRCSRWAYVTKEGTGRNQTYTHKVIT